MDWNVNDARALVLECMKNPRIYLDTFWTDVHSDEIKEAYSEILQHGGALSQCSKETQALYKKMYCNIKRLQSQKKTEKANSFFINFASDAEFKQLLEQYGLSAYSDVIRIGDSKKAAKAFVNMLIPIIEEHLNVKGLRPAKNCSMMSRNLFDFSAVEIQD